LDDLGAHRASFTRPHNPVATQEMVTESNVIKANKYVRPSFHTLSGMGYLHKHTYFHRKAFPWNLYQSKGDNINGERRKLHTTEQNTRTAGTLVTDAHRLHFILCAAL
jgi:hypothetical protein